MAAPPEVGIHGSDVTLDTISSPTAFDALAPEWDELVRAMDRPTPFLVQRWLSTWWRHFGDGSELTVHVAKRDGKLVAAVPLYVGRKAGLRVARFIGGVHSALADMLVAPGEDRSVARALADHVAAGPQDLADLFGLPGDSRLAQGVGPERLQVIQRVEAPVLDMSDGWQAVYEAKTSSKKRNHHRRRRRQLSELGRLETEVARTEEELRPALEEAFRLHRLRWDGRPDGSKFATDSGVAFHADTIRALAPIGLPRIVLLRLDGKAIAFHYYFAFCGRMFVNRLAFDPAFARYSPGLVNTLDALEAASQEGLTYVEFLGADERYKVELADRLAPMYQGVGLAGSMRGRAAAAGALAAIRLRRRLKRASLVRRFYFEGLAPVRKAAGRLSR